MWMAKYCGPPMATHHIFVPLQVYWERTTAINDLYGMPLLALQGTYFNKYLASKTNVCYFIPGKNQVATYYWLSSGYDGTCLTIDEF
jgi:hypothetical protein